MGERTGSERLTTIGPRLPATTVRAYVGRALQPSVPRRLGSIELRPHQSRGAAHLLALLRSAGGALLADDVGLGKTFTALAVARAYHHPLVVAPAVLRDMWARAAERAGVHVEFGSHERLSRRDVGGAFDLVVVDEAHHARTPATRRYAALARACAQAHVLLLSATPIHNHARDLQSLFALFLGQHAQGETPLSLRRLVVRRTHADVAADVALPDVHGMEWLTVRGRRGVLRAVCTIPPPLPLADGASARALFTLSLVRLWTSSEAALRAGLRRLVARALALQALAERGRWPTRREFRTWRHDTEGAQLAFDFVASPAPASIRRVQRALARHLLAARRVLGLLDRSGRNRPGDAVRARHLSRIVQDAAGPVVAFTQFESTARGLYALLRTLPGVAVCSATGARMSGQPLPRALLLRALGPPGADAANRHDAGAGPSSAATGKRAEPLPDVRLLLTTDLLSEGVNLQRAVHVVHLDLPWTPARLAQRLGRLRRPASTVNAIRVSAFTLPDDAEAVLGLVRALERKVDASSRVGFADALSSSLPWAPHPSSDIDAADAELDAVLVGWRAADATADVRGIPVAVVAHSAPVGWHALALTRVAGNTQLVLLTEGEARTDARSLVAALPLFQSGDVDADVPAAVLAKWHDWAASRRGATIISPRGAAASPAAARLIRRLQLLARRARRSDRPLWGDALTLLRDALAGAHGVHAERLLAGADLREPADVRALAQTLTSARPARSDVDEHERAELLALLVAVPTSSLAPRRHTCACPAPCLPSATA